VRTILQVTLFVASLLPGRALAADLFMLDQRFGSIAFSVDHFGTFSSLGNFPRFMGKLLIDRFHPEQTKIDVEADATAVTVPWQGGTEMLRSPEFFDTTQYRTVRFSSNSITGVDPRHFQVMGVLEIRGIKHPLTLDATLERQQADPATGAEIADLTVTGTLSRADYGMTTQQMMISDQVKLLIDARIELPAQAR
jgi:polyisoprenoid-binding protein YceI